MGWRMRFRTASQSSSAVTAATIQGGDRWLEKIERELKDPQTRMLVSLVSPQSVREPWISVELGAAWIRGHAVFPLCHSGQEPGALRRPLGDFGGVALSDDEAAERLIGAVEQAAGLTVPKKWPRRDLLDDLRQAAGQAVAAPAKIYGEGVVTRRATGPAAQETGLPGEQVNILRSLADAQNKGQTDIQEGELPQRCGLKPAIYSYHAALLERRNLISVTHTMYGSFVNITADGNGWLIEHNEMPE